MYRILISLSLAMLMAGCDVAGTAATATTGAESAAQQAKDARETENRVREQIGAAYQQAAQQRESQDSDGR